MVKDYDSGRGERSKGKRTKGKRKLTNRKGTKYNRYDRVKRTKYMRIKQKRNNHNRTKRDRYKHKRTKYNRTNRVKRNNKKRTKQKRLIKQYLYGGSIVNLPSIKDSNKMIDPRTARQLFDVGDKYLTDFGKKFIEWFRKIIYCLYNWCLTTVPHGNRYNVYDSIDGNQHSLSMDTDLTGNDTRNLYAHCSTCSDTVFDWIQIPHDIIEDYRKNRDNLLYDYIRGWTCTTNGLTRLSIPWRCTGCGKYWEGKGSGESGSIEQTKHDMKWLKSYAISERKNRSRLGLKVVPQDIDTPSGDRKEYVNAWILPSNSQLTEHSTKSQHNFRNFAMVEYKRARDAKWEMTDEGFVRRNFTGSSKRAQGFRAAAVGTAGAATVMLAPAVAGLGTGTIPLLAGKIAAAAPAKQAVGVVGAAAVEPVVRHAVMPVLRATASGTKSVGKWGVEKGLSMLGNAGDVVGLEPDELEFDDLNNVQVAPDNPIKYFKDEFYTFISKNSEFEAYTGHIMIIQKLRGLPSDLSGRQMIDKLRNRYINSLNRRHTVFNLLTDDEQARVKKVIEDISIDQIVRRLIDLVSVGQANSSVVRVARHSGKKEHP